MNNLEILERERLRQDIIKVLKTEAYKQFPEIKELTLDVKIVEMNDKEANTNGSND